LLARFTALGFWVYRATKGLGRCKSFHFIYLFWFIWGIYSNTQGYNKHYKKTVTMTDVHQITINKANLTHSLPRIATQYARNRSRRLPAKVLASQILLKD
jgi:hypothetical protein